MTEETKTNLYIGPDEVLSVEDSAEKTEFTGDLVLVHFVNSQFDKLMPKVVYESLVTKEPTDMNSLHERRVSPVVNVMAIMMIRYGLTYSEILDACRKTADKMQDSFERATNFLWTKDDRNWSPGVPVLNNKSVIVADLILSNNINKYAGEQSDAQGAQPDAVVGGGETASDSHTG